MSHLFQNLRSILSIMPHLIVVTAIVLFFTVIFIGPIVFLFFAVLVVYPLSKLFNFDNTAVVGTADFVWEPISMTTVSLISTSVIVSLIGANFWEQQKEHIRRQGYRAYLDSSEWQGKRADALERADGRCQICNRSGRLQVHHRTYARLGEENPNDLTVLCNQCHGIFHAGGRMPEEH